MEINLTKKMSAEKCPACSSVQIKFWHEKNNFNLFRCEGCELIFVSPTPPEDKKLYSQDYFCGESNFGYTDYDRDKSVMKSVFEKYLKIIEGIYPQKGVLLDVGAATGYFLNIAKTNGWTVSGLEISDFAASEARKKGLNVQTGTLKNTNFNKNSFDTITFLDVFEHLGSPGESLKITNGLLKNKGLLVINLPDAGSLYATVMGKYWHAFVPPEHLFYFNKTNLNILLKNTGFKILETKKIGKRFTLPYIFQILSRPRLVKIAEKLHLGKIPIPINLRDNLFVIAEKI